jgi:arylsulfatase A-like enzyme
VPKAVFVIVVDTLRPDRLSCYGYRAHQTPHIDRLAASGVLFERMHAAASWTGPSMGTIMTSRYPTQLGMIERHVGQTTFRPHERRKQINNAIPMGAHTLAEMMREAGFHTAAFVNQAFINAHEGYMQGFQEWCHTVDTDKVAWDDPTRPAPALSVPRDAELGHADGVLIDAFVEWLNATGDGRPFVWLHLLRPHWPYVPPPTYMADHPLSEDPSALYDGEVRATDDDIGRVLDAIDRRYGLDRCLIIFTSDHGEAFGEHDGFGHGHSLHTEVSHVPMILHAPGLPMGARVATIVRTADILPTVLELTSVVPDTTEPFVGESLVGLIAHGGKDRAGYAAGMLYEGTERSWMRNGYRVMFEVAGDEKYSLYNMETDPLEESDVSARHPDLFNAMRGELNALNEQFTADFEASPGDAAPESAADKDAEDERTLRSLRALGYIK